MSGFKFSQVFKIFRFYLQSQLQLASKGSISFIKDHSCPPFQITIRPKKQIYTYMNSQEKHQEQNIYLRRTFALTSQREIRVSDSGKRPVRETQIHRGSVSFFFGKEKIKIQNQTMCFTKTKTQQRKKKEEKYQNPKENPRKRERG